VSGWHPYSAWLRPVGPRAAGLPDLPYSGPDASYAYLIFRKGNWFYVKNGSTGLIEFSGADAADVIQKAIDAVEVQGGGRVFLKQGTYPLSRTIIIKDNVHLVGEHWIKTVLKLQDGVNDDVIRGVAYNVILENFTIDGNKLNQTAGHGIHACLQWGLLRRLYIFNTKQDGIFVGDDALTSELKYILTIYECFISDADRYGIYHEWIQTDSWILKCNIGAAQACLRCGGNVVRVFHNHLNGNPVYCVYMTGTEDYTFIGNLLENSKRHLFFSERLGYASATKKLTILGNMFKQPGTEEANKYDQIRIEGTDVGPTYAQDIIIQANKFWDQQARARYVVSTNDYADYFIIRDNAMRNAAQVSPLINIAGTHNIVKRNLGWVTENSDVLTASGDGAATEFNISSHGLAESPTDPSRIHAEATPVSSDAQTASPCAIYPIDLDADGAYEALRVKFASAPAAGTNNVKVRWRAELD